MKLVPETLVISAEELKEIRTFCEAYQLDNTSLTLNRYNYRMAVDSYTRKVAIANERLARFEQKGYTQYDGETIRLAVEAIGKQVPHQVVANAIARKVPLKVMHYIVNVLEYEIPSFVFSSMRPTSRDDFALFDLLAKAKKVNLFEGQRYLDWLHAIATPDFALLDLLEKYGAPLTSWIGSYFQSRPESSDLKRAILALDYIEHFKTYRYFLSSVIQAFAEHYPKLKPHEKNDMRNTVALLIERDLHSNQAENDGLYACASIIDRTFGFKARLEKMRAYNSFEEARAFCLAKMQQYPELRGVAMVELARLLLDKNIVLNEENDPVQHYSQNNVIKAFYFLQQSGHPSAETLKRNCYEQLRKRGAPVASADNCTDEARRYYGAYLAHRTSCSLDSLARQNRSEKRKLQEEQPQPMGQTVVSMDATLPIAVDETPISLADLLTLGGRFGLIPLLRCLEEVIHARQHLEESAGILLGDYNRKKGIIECCDAETLQDVAMLQRSAPLKDAIMNRYSMNVVLYCLDVLGTPVNEPNYSALFVAYETNRTNYALFSLLLQRCKKEDLLRYFPAFQHVFAGPDVEMIDWLISKEVAVFSAMKHYLSNGVYHIHRQAERNREASVAQFARSFIVLFHRYTDDFLSPKNDFSYPLQQIPAIAKAADQLKIERYSQDFVEVLRKALTRCLETNNDVMLGVIEELLLRLDVKSGVNSAVNAYLQQGNQEAAKEFCLTYIKRTAVTEEEKKQADYARIELATLLLQRKVSLNDPTKTNSENMHAVHAFYYVRTLCTEEAEKLKEQCHRLLSPSGTSSVSQETWTAHAKFQLNVYTLSIEAPNDPLAMALVNQYRGDRFFTGTQPLVVSEGQSPSPKL